MSSFFGHGLGWTAGHLLLLLLGMLGCAVSGESGSVTPPTTFSTTTNTKNQSANSSSTTQPSTTQPMVGASCWLSAAGPGGGVSANLKPNSTEATEITFGCHSEWRIYEGDTNAGTFPAYTTDLF
jgi:hypothetical protein